MSSSVCLSRVKRFHFSPVSFVNEDSEERPGVEAEVNRGGEFAELAELAALAAKVSAGGVDSALFRLSSYGNVWTPTETCSYSLWRTWGTTSSKMSGRPGNTAGRSRSCCRPPRRPCRHCGDSCHRLTLCFRFFFGKNKVMIVALGKGETDEYKDNLHKVGERICLNTIVDILF